MRRVEDEVLEAVGAFRSVIGWPASVNERENERKKNALFKEHLTKAIQYSFLFFFYILCTSCLIGKRKTGEL